MFVDGVYKEEVEDVEDEEITTEGGGGGGGGGTACGGAAMDTIAAGETKPEETNWFAASLYLYLSISAFTALSSDCKA